MTSQTLDRPALIWTPDPPPPPAGDVAAGGGRRSWRRRLTGGIQTVSAGAATG